MADVSSDMDSTTPLVLREGSPSPEVMPSLAIGACPLLDREVSTNSSVSTVSTRSTSSSRSDAGTAAVRRRGYMRPQGTSFADSARNRDSVMSLGSIAHMQYYFARTGLLDGKGAQLAKEAKQKAHKENEQIIVVDPECITPPLSTDGTSVEELVGEWVAAEASAERRPSSEVSLDDDNARASAFPDPPTFSQGEVLGRSAEMSLQERVQSNQTQVGVTSARCSRLVRVERITGQRCHSSCLQLTHRPSALPGCVPKSLPEPKADQLRALRLIA
ncbi:hypothetical protein M8818_004408 [Zalaria obscura]|uniref:Uncharacterized protein n=1 Tax=Zalaria obscura TaxID=2024903 RepID=A0ACC3SB16_9PEZI